MSRRHGGAQRSRAGCTQPSSEAPATFACRKDRLERIIGEEIEGLLRDEAADPSLEGVRIVSVTLSVDGRHAQIGYVVDGALVDEGRLRNSSKHALSRGTGFLRARLASYLDLKRAPNLSFTFIGVRDPALQGELDEEKGGEP